MEAVVSWLPTSSGQPEARRVTQVEVVFTRPRPGMCCRVYSLSKVQGQRTPGNPGNVSFCNAQPYL
jgi:hypothetical protein